MFLKVELEFLVEFGCILCILIITLKLGKLAGFKFRAIAHVAAVSSASSAEYQVYHTLVRGIHVAKWDADVWGLTK